MEKEFLTLIHLHQRIIHKVSRMYTDHTEDRKDLFQDIVFQLWKSYPSFKGTAKISTWMYRIALNTALAARRKSKPELYYNEILPEKAEEVFADDEREAYLYIALKKLPESERALIALLLEDLSYQEIAEITGLSVSNTGVKINRIKEKLKNILNQ